MTYDIKIKKLALDLHNEGITSAEKICEKLYAKYPSKTEKLTARTIRKWIKDGENSSQQDERIIGFDINIFKKSDMILSEQNLRVFLNDLFCANGVRDKYDNSVQKYLWFFSYESNKYISPKIQSKHKNLIDALNSLMLFMDKHFYPPDSGSVYCSKLWVPGPYHFEGEMFYHSRDKYVELQTELHDLAQKAQQAYLEYRSIVKLILVL
jgi:hypothetical protein